MKLKATNGHILVTRCPDPAQTIVGRIEVANLGKRGIIIGLVRYIDDEPIYDAQGNPKARPHICKVGDVVYARDPDFTGSLKDDGNEDLLAIRENLIFAVVSESQVKALTPSQRHELVQQMEAQVRANVAAAQIAAPALIQQ